VRRTVADDGGIEAVFREVVFVRVDECGFEEDDDDKRFLLFTILDRPSKAIEEEERGAEWGGEETRIRGKGEVNEHRNSKMG